MQMQEMRLNKELNKTILKYLKGLRKKGFRKLSTRQKWENYKFVEMIGNAGDKNDIILVKDRIKTLYFGKEVEEAIIRYNASESDSERNRIYQNEIHKAFDKLAENIINTFKFTYFDYGFEDIKCETVSFLVMNMHKYNPSKGYKAFSYFSVVAKNYLILHNNNNYKKLKLHHNIDNLNSTQSAQFSYNSDDDDGMSTFIRELVDYFEIFIPKTFKKPRDLSIAYSILELLSNIETIENFNKKALYLLIREMTGYNTSHITKIVNIMKEQYNIVAEEYHRHGTIMKDSLPNKFFN